MRTTGAQQYVTAVLLLSCLLGASAASQGDKPDAALAVAVPPAQRQNTAQEPEAATYRQHGKKRGQELTLNDPQPPYGGLTQPHYPGPHYDVPSQPQYPSQPPYGGPHYPSQPHYPEHNYDVPASPRYRSQPHYPEAHYRGSDYSQPPHGPEQTYLPPKLDPVGETYLLPTTLRTLTRPDNTTLSDLAANMRTGATGQQRTAREAQKTLDALRKLPNLRRHRLSPHASHSKQPAVPNKAPGKEAPPAKTQRPPALHSRVPAQEVHAASADGGHYGGYGQPNSRVDLSFRGLNAFEQATANQGRQFEVVPPDQGLCVGNGFVLETVNTVLRVYSAASGEPLLAPVDLNTFYDLAPQYDPTTDQVGPYITDPSCVFDTDSRRWFHVVSSAEVDSDTGDFTGPTFVDVAVSETADPTGVWKLYRTSPNTVPNGGCENGFCLQDFPQMAVWKAAVIITSNEYDIFNETFNGAAVYAVDKAALLAGAQNANTAFTRTGEGPNGVEIGSLQPARQAGDWPTPNTFLMATPGGSGATLQVFSLVGTETLGGQLQSAQVSLNWVQRSLQLDVFWSVPPAADQRRGVNPFGLSVFGISRASLLDSGDSSLGSVSYVDGRLYTTWGTSVMTEAGSTVAGIAWAVVDPHHPAKALQSGLLRAPCSNHLLFPYMAVRPGGEGVVACSISGPDYYPSPAYAVLSRQGLGQLTVITPGVGVLDEFLGYEAPDFTDRFGDYSGAVLDEDGAFWVASEYVAQSCTVKEFEDFTCTDTRGSATNWATRVTRVRLD